MKRLIYLLFIVFFVLPTIAPLYGQYHDIGLSSWKNKLSKRIKGKPLITLVGDAATPNSDPIRMHAVGGKGLTAHKKGGGLYMLQLDLDSGDKIVQLVTTRLNGTINDTDKLKVFGAYDELNIFICRKILIVDTNSYVVDW